MSETGWVGNTVNYGQRYEGAAAMEYLLVMPSSDFSKAEAWHFLCYVFSFKCYYGLTITFKKYTDQLKHLDHLSVHSVPEGVL